MEPTGDLGATGESSFASVSGGEGFVNKAAVFQVSHVVLFLNYDGPNYGRGSSGRVAQNTVRS